MTLDVEGVADGGVGGEKPLRRSSRFETLHSSFALSDRQVRILGPVVLPATKIRVPGKAQILQSGTVRWQFVCDNGNRDKAPQAVEWRDCEGPRERREAGSCGGDQHYRHHPERPGFPRWTELIGGTGRHSRCPRPGDSRRSRGLLCHRRSQRLEMLLRNHRPVQVQVTPVACPHNQINPPENTHFFMDFLFPDWLVNSKP